MTAEQADKLKRFAEYVWREAVPRGLSGRKSIEEIYAKDILDSLLLTPHIPKAAKVLDIGSGAGFPGIPIKIFYESIALSILDAKQKAIHFLEEVKEEFDLKKLEVTHGRAEEFNRKTGWKNGFDVVLSRGVAPIERFLPWAVPFIVSGGTLILQKGRKLDEELDAAHDKLRKLKMTIEAIHPGLEGEQKIVILRKNR